jgi:UDP-glucose 4-epimerase
LIKGDIFDHEMIERACRDIVLVCYMAANPDVILGALDTKIHFNQNILATYNLLEAIRKKR